MLLKLLKFGYSFFQISSFVNDAQRFSYEQYGSKLAFTFRYARSEIFWFCFFFFSIKAKSQRFRDLIKIRKPRRLRPNPVLFIGFVVKRFFATI